MVKKKIDNRIRVMIENGIKLGHRTMFVIIGDKARDQVPILYDILTKSTVKARPTVLWCYKNKDEAISNHGKKRLKQIAAGKVDVDETNMFDAFRVATTIHGRYYTETHSILGRTYGVCVLQDFEALTPNLMARTIETVEGGGLIIFLLKTLQSLKQLYTMSMDVHKRYRTEAHQTVTCRFNERLILSLADCKRCLVVNDDLTVLPLSSKTINVKPVDLAAIVASENESALKDLQHRLNESPPAGPLIKLCKTYDQARAVVQFIELIAEKQLKPPCTLTAPRGRGKSAALGISIAAAVAFGYVNIYVTSPHPENLITLFEFVFKGFDALDFHEHMDYTIIRSTNINYNKAIIRINVTRSSRQTIQYIAPSDAHLLNAADLLLIDEAAAIPLPLVKKMLGPYLIFMTSTINGYEGTGRSLSLKLIAQLQKTNNAPPPIELNESIRYHEGDDIEQWLINLLCLNVTNVPAISTNYPTPDVCELYYIDRDTLFSYHKCSEAFLHSLVSIYVASHYKNSPNDLQMMSDAPAHHLFCLLGPIQHKDRLPEILVVIQVALEGEISERTINNSLGLGRKASGDLIPWNIVEQYGDRDFPKLSGIRIIRIATNPNYQRMGYGKHALKLLKDYYKQKFIDLSESRSEMNIEPSIEEIEQNELGLLKEKIRPRSKLPTLLKTLVERPPEAIDYIGTSYGLTLELLQFWKKADFVPVYLSQKTNDITGEHTCIMLHTWNKDTDSVHCVEWLSLYYNDFRRRIIKLLGKTFRDFSCTLSLSLLSNKCVSYKPKDLDKLTLDVYFLPHDLKRLESYVCSQVEFRLILDLVSDVAQLYFQDRLSGVQINALQSLILLGIGIQGKTVDAVGAEINMPGHQVLSKFFDIIKKSYQYIQQVLEGHTEGKMIKGEKLNHGDDLEPLMVSLNDELEETAQKLEQQQRSELKKLKKLKFNDFAEYAIRGSNEEWTKALSTNTNVANRLVSIKSGTKSLDEPTVQVEPPTKKSKMKKKKNKCIKI